jgi:hypothetical protein
MNEILEFLVGHTNQIRLYHWKTKSFSRHKATDKYLQKVEPIIDAVIESLQGGRETRINDSFTSKFITLTDQSATEYLKRCRFWLENRFPILLNENETDVLNLRDEILANLTRLMYIFTLK